MNLNFPADPHAVLLAALGAGAGVYWFALGFRELKAKRIIQNIPTSKINTGAVGTNVEVKGRIVAEKDHQVVAPISNRPCVIYSIEIQKWGRRRSGSGIDFGHPAGGQVDFGKWRSNSTRHGHWETIDHFYSHKGFYLDDNSGANAMVLVDGAEIRRKGSTRDYELTSDKFDEMHGPLLAALTKYKRNLRKFKLKTTSVLFSNKYRFREWCFTAGEPIYVLGYADTGLRPLKNKKARYKTFIKAKHMIQADPLLQKEFDANGDGTLDFDELEAGAKTLAEELQAQYSPEKLNQLAARTKMVFKKSPPNPFYISNLPEADLVKGLSLTSTLKIWGGPVLTLACSAYLWNVIRMFL